MSSAFSFLVCEFRVSDPVISKVSFYLNILELGDTTFGYSITLKIAKNIRIGHHFKNHVLGEIRREDLHLEFVNFLRFKTFKLRFKAKHIVLYFLGGFLQIQVTWKTS